MNKNLSLIATLILSCSLVTGVAAVKTRSGREINPSTQQEISRPILANNSPLDDAIAIAKKRQADATAAAVYKLLQQKAPIDRTNDNTTDTAPAVTWITENKEILIGAGIITTVLISAIVIDLSRGEKSMLRKWYNSKKLAFD